MHTQTIQHNLCHTTTCTHTHTHVSKHSPVTLAIRQISEIINSVNSQEQNQTMTQMGHTHTHTDSQTHLHTSGDDR